MAYWIWIPFEVVSGVSLWMRVLDASGDRQRGKGSFGANFGHPFVTNGDFVVQLLSAVTGGNVALSKLLWDFLLYYSNATAGTLQMLRWQLQRAELAHWSTQLNLYHNLFSSIAINEGVI